MHLLLTRARRIFAYAAAVADAAALVAALLPISGTACAGASAMSAAAPGAAPGPAAPQPVPQVCRHTSLLAACSSPVGAAAWLLLLSAAGIVPFLTLGGRRGWPSAVAAALVAIAYLVSFGVFLYWLPMMLCCLAAALAPAERPVSRASD